MSEVLLGDGIAGLESLDEGEAGLILSDLPSGATRAEFDRPIDLRRFWPAAWRALRHGGNVVLMASSFEYAFALATSCFQWFRYDLVWSKSAATGHLNSASRPLRAHEFVLVFSREGDATYHVQMQEGATPIHRARRSGHGENYKPATRPTDSRAGATDRFPVSVLEFASVGTSSKDRVHPQQKPEEMLRWLVRSYSDVGDLVVDPCAGSGSAGRSALAEGRRFKGWDLSPRFGASLGGVGHATGEV